MSLAVFFRWTSKVQNKKITGTILTTPIISTPFLGIGFKSSSDKEEIVECEFHSHNGINDNFEYKIKAVPLTEELKYRYGTGETYYTGDFSSLVADNIGFSINGYTSEIKKSLRDIISNFRKGNISENTYEEGSIQHFYLNELIEEKIKDDEYKSRLANQSTDSYAESNDWY
ncbi:MAG: hypothetical protein [Caudoviricetes sp.]|nr:MAG: hypothetical protein [Caudoviricetes sp.]